MTPREITKNKDIKFYEWLLECWEWENKGQACKGEPYKIASSEFGDLVSLYVEKNKIIIVVPGSDNCDEWQSNIRAFPPINGFHRDAWKVANQIFVQLYPHILDLRRAAVLPIEIICHSRGGYGVILELLLREAGFGGISTVTFGSMRPMTKRGAERCRKAFVKHTRVDTERDPVPHLPPKVFPPFTWCHYETDYVCLPNVPGKFDHLHYGDAIKEMIARLKSEQVVNG